ncbi:hypothetical protein JZ751_004177 [Albula glossodonta]|uniref:Tetratricopeptide repeat protein 17 n=1 Tax=Albula glossodonta TaxID=121402 RepID=A0A8T2NDC6_9TELE|nr:hypothetical protein JZ751_004177 [Albula glossodonta]
MHIACCCLTLPPCPFPSPSLPSLWHGPGPALAHGMVQKQLVAQKIHIEENEDRDTGLEQRHYKEDPDCVTAKVPLGDLDLYDGTFISLESKDISHPGKAGLSTLSQGVQERVNLTSPLLSNEDPIFSSLSHKLGRSVDEAARGLNNIDDEGRNSSSWVLYDLASFYWRMKNKPKKAVDCAVRALHFSPRQHKDIALVNMANVLHRAHFSADAAMLGEYNHSVLCYEQALQARPGFEQALRRKHAVLCQQKLEQRLEAQHRSLQRTLNELKEYQRQHDHYLRQQEALEKHKLIQEEQILRNIIHETQMAKEAQLGEACWEGVFGEEVSVASSVALSSEMNVNETRNPQPYTSVSGGDDPDALWGRDPTPVAERQALLWPRRADCARRFPSVPLPHLLPTFYLTPETRGFGAAPPDCGPNPQPLPGDLPESVGRALEGEGLPDADAVQVLRSRSGGLNLDQAGALIAQALKKSGAPRWLVQNEAALFWRAKGNGTRALSCMRHALRSTPSMYRDLSLVNAANLLLHHGLTEEAGKLLQEALTLNTSEPVSVLSQVSVYLAQGKVRAALGMFRQALLLRADCAQCRASLPLLRCLQFYPLLYNLACQRDCRKKGSGGAGMGMGVRAQDLPPAVRPLSLSPVEDPLLFESKATPLFSCHSLKPHPYNDGATGVRGGGPCFGNCEDDEGAEWITFQVKRVRKSKADSPDGGGGEEDVQQGEPSAGHSILEISGPTIPSPGPSGRWRDYASLGWPGPEECQRTRRVEPTTVASTWLAVSAKNIDITEHIDFATPLQEPAVEPVCSANLPASMHTLDHLGGVANRAGIHYTGESQLKEVPLLLVPLHPYPTTTPPNPPHPLEPQITCSPTLTTQTPYIPIVLQNLGKDKFSPQSFEQVGTRIAKVLEKNQTSWVLSSMAALYWRVKGQGKRAIDCLRQALNHAPHHMKDVPLISLANIFQNARLWDDALTVARMAVEIAPQFVVNHFTLANVYIAMEEFEKAMLWYENTLKLQPEFAPAKDRLRTIQCYLLTKRERRSP